MKGRDSVQSLLVLRKLTRAIAETARAQMTEYLATLAPLLRPSSILGDYVVGGQKETTRKAEKAYQELQALYERIATTAPYNLPRELRPPFNLGPGGLEITPVESPHVASAESGSRTITVRSPLTWTLTYTDFPPMRLSDQLATKLRSADELQKIVVSYLAMHVVTSQQPGLMRMLEALRFPVTSVRVPGWGDLPVTRIGLRMATYRPADGVIIESAELTGVDAFEEVVSVEEIATLPDPLKKRLTDIAQEHMPDRMAGTP